MACLDDGLMDQERRFTQPSPASTAWPKARTACCSRRPTDRPSSGSRPRAAPDLPLAGDWRLITFLDGDVASSTLAGTDVTLTIDT